MRTLIALTALLGVGCTITKVDDVERVKRLEQSNEALRAEVASLKTAIQNRSLSDQTADSLASYRIESMVMEIVRAYRSEDEWRARHPILPEWSDEVKEAILRHKVSIGMKMPQVLAAWGPPANVSKTETSDGTTYKITFKSNRYWHVTPPSSKIWTLSMFSKADENAAEVKEISEQ